ncbi:hypothetical protein CCACVL1_10782 [Corchorus capsularis]|uniref:Uncharacterized protein n=1 Tax=Corchorus capsularis TaxID=210143 RepID=A0A1R3IPV2_COCAP|nr:hypothetical protein CCACVL1_10782 [Corchorus capsularis]
MEDGTKVVTEVIRGTGSCG